MAGALSCSNLSCLDEPKSSSAICICTSPCRPSSLFATPEHQSAQVANPSITNWCPVICYSQHASDLQTKHAKAWCIAFLTDSLQTSSAHFTILSAALQAGVPSLLRAALAEACRNFSQGLAADLLGWSSLSQDAVLLVLCSPKLQVTACTTSKWNPDFKASAQINTHLSVSSIPWIT